ncbi:hypothetical protein Btru_062072 [Bulinus truncatus]|nr:hypothetical protein Btru_062072 [Bulinus truncatus]
MGKERKLLKAVHQKDLAKVQQLLSPLTYKKEKEKVQLYFHSRIYVLDGSIDIARELIYHSAELTARDAKGNTALHFAVFRGSLDLIELLLANSVEVNAVNNDGNTALHISCQSQDRAVLGCEIIKKLLESGIDVWIKNKFKLTALDLAASFNKKEVVRLLLHHVPLLRNNSRAIVEASVRGFTNIVELLLEYGVSCNGLDENSGSSALHEAVRFNRIEVVKLLVAFQANPDLQNSNRETPRILAYELPSLLSQKIAPFFQDHSLVTPRSPKMINSIELLESAENNNTVFTCQKSYPELPNDLTWTKNEPLYCSSCTEKNPNSHILDGNLFTFWVIPVLHDAWTILDLHSEHIITGITIYGWNSPQMIKTVHLQCALSINGPWKNVTTLECKCQGSTDSKDPASPQKFTGFSFCSQYIRLYLLDNHSGSYMCFQGIQLHGADHQILNALAHCGLQMLADNFINKGVNTWKNFLDVSCEVVDELVSDSHSKSKLWELIYAERRKMYPLKVLSWLVPPPTCASVGETLPDFSVQSDPGVSEMIELSVPDTEVLGKTCIRLKPNLEGKPSIATFSNITIKSGGTFYFTVKGETSETILISSKPTEVRPSLRSEKMHFFSKKNQTRLKQIFFFKL